MNLWIDVAFVASFLGLDWAASMHVVSPVGITPWNPSTGLALAWLVLRGPARALPLLLVNILSDEAIKANAASVPTVVVTNLVAVGIYTLAAEILIRRLQVQTLFPRLQDLIVLLIVAAVAAACAALINVLLFVWAGELPASSYVASVLRQWVGDIIGIAVVTPVILRAQAWREWTWKPSVAIIAETTLAMLSIAGLLWIVFGVESTNEYKVFYLLFLPVVAIAVRHGIDGACLALVFTQVGMITLIQSRGLGQAAMTDFQVLLLSLTITGLLTGVVVSERQRAERASREADRRLRERQHELEHASRVSSLGEMASQLAHELNQPMTASRAYIKAAQRLLLETGPSVAPGPSRALESISHAITQIDLAGAIVRNLRDLIRRRSAPPEHIELREIVEQSLALVRAQVRQSAIDISLRAAPNLPPIQAERIRIQQVLINLLRNAIDAVEAMPAHRRQIAIALSPVPDAHGEMQILVSVRDRGGGIPADIQTNLFNAFTTSKPDGLGLGLSICRGIVEAYAGRLWLNSTGEEGSEFCFTLPATNAKMYE
jgi:two-component system sensor kinase FixL